MRKKTLFTLGLILAFHVNAKGQTDDRKSLFNAPKSKYQWDLGKTYFTYSRNGMPKQYRLTGTTIDFIGFVLKDRLNLGLGMDYVAAPLQNFDPHPNDTAALYRMLNYGNFYFKIEPLVRQRKLINFSFPIRIGFGGATYEFVKAIEQGSFIGTFSDEFLIVSPGANVMVNLFKNLSVGIGASHRFIQPINTELNATQNHFSAQCFIRFKLGGNSKS